MNKLSIFLIPLLICGAASASNNSIDNILNGNGKVGNVTINQTNSMTNEQVETEKKIASSMAETYSQSQSGLIDTKTASAQLAFDSMAKEINATNGTNNQKNELCKSKAKLSAELLGYKLDFAYGECDNYFHN